MNFIECKCINFDWDFTTVRSQSSNSQYSSISSDVAWHRPGNKPLSETMMVSLLTHICVIWSQWVNMVASVSDITLENIAKIHWYQIITQIANGGYISWWIVYKPHPWIIMGMGMGSANERRRYYVMPMPPLIGRAHTQDALCLPGYFGVTAAGCNIAENCHLLGFAQKATSGPTCHPEMWRG